jgi:hypothetical protein
MRIFLLSVLLLGDRALGLVAKRFPSSSYQLKERHYAPRSWSKVGAAPGDHIISLRIGLTQSRFDELEKNLYEGMEKTKAPVKQCCVRPAVTLSSYLCYMGSLGISC